MKHILTRKQSAIAALQTLLTAIVVLIVAAPAMAADGVMVSGIQTDFGEELNRGGGGNGYSIDDLCSAGPIIEMAMGDIVGGIDSAMTSAGSPITMNVIESLPGAPNRADVSRDLENARNELCDGSDPQTTTQPFVMTYSSCRMGMYTPTQAMLISMPEGSDSAYMLVVDHSTREIMHLNLTRRVGAVTDVIGSGWSNLIEINPTGQSGEHIGYSTASYSFEHTSGLGDSDLGEITSDADIQAGTINSAQAFGNMVSTTTSGSAWISDDVPGIDIVQSFYRNLTTQMEVNQGNSFFGGLIQNMVGMLDKGMPLEIESTVSSSVMGRTMMSGKSKSVVGNIRITELRSDWCAEQPMPEGYTITDVDEQMEEAMSGAGSSPEMAEAMAEYNEAMQNLTPEQKQMMEQLGMGGGMAGAASAGTGAGAAGAGANATTAAPANSSRSDCVSSGVSSSDLTTDSVTESVQKHLDALGYDAGNTSGEESMMTTVSISQYQAERGMEVTGEISPQLLGSLAAEVDNCN